MVHWNGILHDDEQSISKQISAMLWDDAVFRMINESRRLSVKRGVNTAAMNGAIARFIDINFVSGQLMAIRRLVDKSKRKDRKTKNWIYNQNSIPRLLSEIKENIDLFTREIWVCHDGLPYDYRPAERRLNKQLMKKAWENGGVVTSWGPTWGPEAAYSSELAHETFDRLCGVTDVEDRRRHDRADPEIVNNLRKTLSVCDDFERTASKTIAHAADAISRNQLSERERNVTLNRLDKCQKRICQVASYISGPLLYIGGGFSVPIAQFDRFEFLDKPWVHENDIASLSQFWKYREETVEQWTQDYESGLKLS